MMFVGGALSAHPSINFKDGNDAKGKYDIKTVAINETANAYVVTVKTFEPWKKKSLAFKQTTGNRNAFFVYVTSEDEAVPIYQAQIFKSKKAQKGYNSPIVAYSEAFPDGEVVGTAKVTKPSRNTLVVSIPVSVASDIENTVLFAATSQYQQAKKKKKCFKKPCHDSAPNGEDSFFGHDLE